MHHINPPRTRCIFGRPHTWCEGLVAEVYTCATCGKVSDDRSVPALKAQGQPADGATT